MEKIVEVAGVIPEPIKIENIMRCPIFREILSKDWVNISKEIEKIIKESGLEYFTIE